MLGSFYLQVSPFYNDAQRQQLFWERTNASPSAHLPEMFNSMHMTLALSGQ